MSQRGFSEVCLEQTSGRHGAEEGGAGPPRSFPFPPPLHPFPPNLLNHVVAGFNFVAWSAHESFSVGMSTVRSQWLRCFHLRLAVVNTCTDGHVHTSTARLRRSHPFSSLLSSSPTPPSSHHTTPHHTTPHHTTPQHNTTQHNTTTQHNATQHNTTQHNTTHRTHRTHTHTHRTHTAVTICLLHTMRNTSGALRFRALTSRSTNLCRYTRLFSFPIFDQLRGCRLRCRFGLRGRTEPVHSIRDQFFCHWSGRAHSH